VRQQETLGRHALAGRVRWLDRLPEGLRGVIIANEVLDAMSVQRFRIKDEAVQELGVVWNGEHFVWQARAAVAEMEGSVRALEQAIGERLPEGYESELHPAYGPWLASMADVLEAGVALLIDYGYPRQEYYRPERSRGTLMCHYRHRAHEDPFLLVGLQDITSYVDFTAVAEAGEAVGLWPAGYTTQAHFLLATGLDAMLSEAAGGDETQYLRLTREAKLLTLPGEMGERFQVLALSRRYEQPLSGFGLRDLLWRLG
jgi:SAM-dependent MidA family methyltransferase